jgi:hypothetical protein
MAKKQKEERVFQEISSEDAAKKVMGLITMWFKLKKDLKDTQAAYKEKISGIEEEIEETLADAEQTKNEAKANK